jgi:hypothetical protein
MRSNTVQLAWPFALIGAAIGAQLPSGASGALLMAAVLGLFGGLISSALSRVRDWQVGVMAPAIGAITGMAVGFGSAGLDGAAIGLIGGVGFGLMTLPALVLITRRAKRAARLPTQSLLGRAYRRRVWLMALTASTMASLVVPAVANPWARPAEAPMAQLCAMAMMLMAMADATIWLTVAQLDPAPGPSLTPSANPYRDAAPPRPAQPDLRVLSALAAASLLYDALLVALVAAALLVSR